MSIVEEIRRETIETMRPQIIESELFRVLSSLVEAKPRLRDRYAALLAKATTLDELRRLEVVIMRDLAE